MTKRGWLTSIAALFFLIALPSTALAQGAFLWAGAGVTFPTGDYGDVTDTGWLGTAGVGVNIGESGAAVFGEGLYGQNGAATATDVDVNVYGAMGGIIYRIGDPEAVGGFVWGGAGLLVGDPDGGDSESEFGYEFGAGVDIPVSGNFGVWFEGRYVGSDTVKLFGLIAGIGIGLGG